MGLLGGGIWASLEWKKQTPKGEVSKKSLKSTPSGSRRISLTINPKEAVTVKAPQVEGSPSITPVTAVGTAQDTNTVVPDVTPFYRNPSSGPGQVQNVMAGVLEPSLLPKRSGKLFKGKLPKQLIGYKVAEPLGAEKGWSSSLIHASGLFPSAAQASNQVTNSSPMQTTTFFISMVWLKQAFPNNRFNKEWRLLTQYFKAKGQDIENVELLRIAVNSSTIGLIALDTCRGIAQSPTAGNGRLRLGSGSSSAPEAQRFIDMTKVLRLLQVAPENRRCNVVSINVNRAVADSSSSTVPTPVVNSSSQPTQLVCSDALASAFNQPNMGEAIMKAWERSRSTLMNKGIEQPNNAIVLTSSTQAGTESVSTDEGTPLANNTAHVDENGIENKGRANGNTQQKKMGQRSKPARSKAAKVASFFNKKRR
jgi:hypothetical protein